MYYTLRQTPKSIERQLPPPEDDIQEAQPYDYANQPDDLPSQDDWFRMRIWVDELEGRALTC